MNKLTKRVAMWALIVAVIQLIPYFGRFPWTAMDYTFATIVLFGTALTYELITENMQSQKSRLLIGASALLVVFLLWGWAVA